MIIFFNSSGTIISNLTKAVRLEEFKPNSYKLWRRSGYKIFKLRNTYQVPSGMEVSVDTPQGEKKYTGGQYVPPEQLQSAHVVEKGASGKQGKAPEQNQPGWPEIAEEFKHVDISNNEELNKSSYRIRQYLPSKVLEPSKIQPSVKFGVEFSIANISNSLPLLGKLLELSKLSILIPQQGEFIQEGTVEENGISYYIQPDLKEGEVLTHAANIIGYLLGWFIFNNIQGITKKQDEKETDLQVAVLQRDIEQRILQNKVKTPEKDPEIQEKIQEISQLEMSKHLSDVITPLLETFKGATMKEGGISIHISSLLPQDFGIQAQFAKIVSYSNLFSLGIKRTFEDGLEDLAGNFPDCLSAFKNILAAMTELNQ